MHPMIIANGDAICNSLGMFFSLQGFLVVEGPMVQATVSFLYWPVSRCDMVRKCASPDLRVPGWAAI